MFPMAFNVFFLLAVLLVSAYHHFIKDFLVFLLGDNRSCITENDYPSGSSVSVEAELEDQKDEDQEGEDEPIQDKDQQDEDQRVQDDQQERDYSTDPTTSNLTDNVSDIVPILFQAVLNDDIETRKQQVNDTTNASSSANPGGVAEDSSIEETTEDLEDTDIKLTNNLHFHSLGNSISGFVNINGNGDYDEDDVDDDVDDSSEELNAHFSPPNESQNELQVVRAVPVADSDSIWQRKRKRDMYGQPKYDWML